MKLKDDNDKHPANQQRIKEENLTLIFNLISRNGQISRAELAQITKLSPTTVSSLVEELEKNKMVIETGEGVTTTSGRKPIMLEVNPNGGYVASVEILENIYRCFVYNLKCKMAFGGTYEIKNLDSVGTHIISKVTKLFINNNVEIEKLMGISIGVPGLIDYESGHVLSSTVIKINPNNNFYNDIKNYFSNIPVILENESCFYAYAEKEYGDLDNINDLVFIEINEGIGSGIIIDGQVFAGKFGTAGEFGHMSVDMNGPKCKCGNYGCLEAIASVPAILENFKEAIKSGKNSILKDLIQNDFSKLSVKMIEKALKSGDKLTRDIINQTAKVLAFGLNNVINLFSPEAIVIGGELTKLGDSFLSILKNYIHSIGLTPNVSRIKIQYSSIEDNSVTLGGAKYLLDNIFNNK